jgi:hypothetical protein
LWWRGAGRILQIARHCNRAGDLPDVSNAFREVGESSHAGGTALLCMGLFSIFLMAAAAAGAKATMQF